MSPSPAPKSGAGSSKQVLLNVLTAAILAVIVCCCFSKTVLQGAPISRLYQLGQRDTLFAKYFTPIREGYDASVYQYFVPCHHFLVRNLRQGIVPLWNPLVGCGEPFMADIETATFWPLRAALIWMEPIRSWNLLIVLNLVTFSLGTFLLGTLAGLRRFAAIFAALICAFCPFMIFHSELIGSSSSWIPLVIASFIWVEKNGTLLSKALAGAACALMIVSGHPEPSFFGISAASLAYILFKLLDRKTADAGGTGTASLPSASERSEPGSAGFQPASNERSEPGSAGFQPASNERSEPGSAGFQPASERSEPGSAGFQPASKSTGTSTLLQKHRILLFALFDIAQIGAFAFAFSAPLLIPFAELLKSSDCYKLGLTDHRVGVPLNSILVNFVHPAYDRCSPFLGVLTIPLCVTAAVGAFKQNHYFRSFLVSALLLICVMSQLGPLDFIMNLPSFSWFVPKYCFPALLVVSCILAGFGVQELIDKINNNWKQVCISIIGASLVVLAALIAIKFAPALLECIRQDEAFEKMAVINKQWTRDIIILTTFCVFTFVMRFVPCYRAILMVAGITVCTILSIAPLTKNAAPVNGGLQYDLVEPLPFLQKQNERIVTMGRHTFCPSSNFVYGINNIVPVNVYHPSGFLTYLGSCGITPEGVNQFFDNDLTPAIDLSATKYVVSPHPVLGANESLPGPVAIPPEEGAKWQGESEMLLEGASLVADPANRQVLGTLRFKGTAQRAKQVGVQAVIRDEKGGTIWYGDSDRILYLFAKNDPAKVDSFDYKLKVPFPKYSGEMTLAIQLFDWEQLRFLPFADAEGETPGVLQIAAIDATGNTTSNIIKKVETRTASDRSVFKLVDEAPNHVRVYENTKALPFCYLTKEIENDATASNSTIIPVKWSRPDCNTIRAEVDAPESMNLVVAEFFEPHWKAQISQNGSESEHKTARANKYFQAIPVQAGKSVVTFRYDPLSFKLGIGVFALGLLLLSLLILKKVRKP